MSLLRHAVAPQGRFRASLLACGLLLMLLVGCHPRKGATGPEGTDATKDALALARRKALRFKVITLKGKADFADLESGRGLGFAYRIDIARDSLMLFNISKMGIPMTNMLVSQDSLKMRFPINNTASACDIDELAQLVRLRLDLPLFQAMILGELPAAELKQAGTAGDSARFVQMHDGLQLSWIVNARAGKLVKLELDDLNLQRSSAVTYADFKKVDGQSVAHTMVMEATQGQRLRIELHHSGIEIDKEKVNFRYRIPESYTIVPCDSMARPR